MENKITEKNRGIFDLIENAITFYLLEKKVNKSELWKYGINVFELSLFIEEYLISGNIQIDKLSGLNDDFPITAGDIGNGGIE